jgi:hypothetical protein
MQSPPPQQQLRKPVALLSAASLINLPSQSVIKSPGVKVVLRNNLVSGLTHSGSGSTKNVANKENGAPQLSAKRIVPSELTKA